jgi:hypothetical protein
VGKVGGNDHRPVLGLQFGQLVDESGRATGVNARLLAIDNARETVDAEGRILGLPPHRALPGEVEALLLLAAHLHPITLGMVESAHLAIARRRRRPSTTDRAWR